MPGAVDFPIPRGVETGRWRQKGLLHVFALPSSRAFFFLFLRPNPNPNPTFPVAGVPGEKLPVICSAVS